MDAGNGLTETVQFELPDLAGAARLATLLRSRWAVSVNEGRRRRARRRLHQGFTHGPPHRSCGPSRTGWRGNRSAPSVQLDGRVYIMESGEVDWEFLPRPTVEVEAA